MSERDNIIQMPETSPRNGGGPGNGDGIDSRLRHLEVELGKAQKDIGHIRETMSTKTDVERLKVWILAGLLSAMAVGATIAAIVVKAFN